MAASSETKLSRMMPSAIASIAALVVAGGERTPAGVSVAMRRPAGVGAPATTPRPGHSLVFQGGRRDAESVRHTNAHQSAHDAEQRVMMDGVRDGVHRLRGRRWKHGGRSLSVVADFAAHVMREIERAGRNRLTGAAQSARVPRAQNADRSPRADRAGDRRSSLRRPRDRRADIGNDRDNAGSVRRRRS